jgi:hypothetical protein
VLQAPASTTIQLRNLGAARVVVDAVPRSVRRRAATKWLSVRPARFALRAGSRTVLTLRAGRRRGIRPGDHELIVLLVTHPLERRRVAVRIRLGVRVRVRMPGRIVRRLDLRGLRVRRRGATRVLLVSLANNGNITEPVRGHVTLALVRGGRVRARLSPDGIRELVSGAHALLAARYAGRLRGLVTAVVRVLPAGRLRPLERRYRIRL